MLDFKKKIQNKTKILLVHSYQELILYIAFAHIYTVNTNIKFSLKE